MGQHFVRAKAVYARGGVLRTWYIFQHALSFGMQLLIVLKILVHTVLVHLVITPLLGDNSPGSREDLYGVGLWVQASFGRTFRVQLVEQQTLISGLWVWASALWHNCIIVMFTLFISLIADEFFKDLQSDLQKRSASRSAKPKSLWEELAVRASFTPSSDLISHISISTCTLIYSICT